MYWIFKKIHGVLQTMLYMGFIGEALHRILNVKLLLQQTVLFNCRITIDGHAWSLLCTVLKRHYSVLTLNLLADA